MTDAVDDGTFQLAQGGTRPDHPVLVLMGVSGTGKSTVGGLLAGRLGWDFEEGDDLHPAANVAKMHAGHPLDDNDRWPWLDRVRAWIAEHETAGRPGIITCSALKRRYRDRIAGPATVFVYLHGPQEVIEQRMTARHGHFMPPALLDSQLADLEPPGDGETYLPIDITDPAPRQAEAILAGLQLHEATRS